MESIRNTKSIRFVRLKMYREDLDALVGLFQKACSVITISDDTNRYDSLAEMKQYVGSRIKNFNIRRENPNVHFLLNKAERVQSGTPGQMMTQLFPELRTEEATDAADNLFYVAKELITSHQQTMITPVVAIFGTFLIVGLFTLGYHGISTGNRGLPVVWIVLAGVDLIFLLVWSNRAEAKGTPLSLRMLAGRPRSRKSLSNTVKAYFSRGGESASPVSRKRLAWSVTVSG